MIDEEASAEQLKRRVQHWAVRLKVSPRVIRVQRMTRKWGSCSTAGTITLASDLSWQEPEFQDFVIAHELLHLRVPTHGRLFRSLMTLHLPGWRKFERPGERRRDFRGGALFDHGGKARIAGGV